MGYAALHCHSFYSLLDGTVSPDDVAAAAHASGMTAAALVALLRHERSRRRGS
jgi:DNA polymerase III alpha subunit